MAEAPKYESQYDGEQIDLAVGAIVNGKIDEAVNSASASAQTAATQAEYATSAAQAVRKALDNIPPGAVPVIDDLTTGGRTAALSAEQGKALNDEKADKQSVEAALSNKVNVPQELPEAVSLDTCVVPGEFYWVGEPSKLQNRPPVGATSLTLKVEKTAAFGTGVIQTISYYHDASKWTRASNSSGPGTWTEWERIATAADLAGKAAIEQGAWSPEHAGQGQSIVLQPPPELPEEKRFPVKIRTFFDQRGDAYLQIILGARWAYLPLSNLVAGIGAQIATATPPQEYDLPLAAGVTGVVKYRKNQFGEETVYGACELTSDIGFGSIFVTLPAGYRPKYAMSFQAFSGSGGQNSTGTVDVGTNGNLNYRLPHTHSGDIFRFFINFIATYGANTLQSQVRMPAARMARTARAAIQAESVDKCMCVADADGNYVEFVMVTITHDELGALYTVHYYELKDGERLVDSQTVPAKRPHAGAPGLVRPRWDDETAAWTEGATAEEIAAWEAEHPAPEPSGPTPDEQMRADIDYLAALGGVAL